MKKGKILAIDYGGAAVGLAVSDIDRQMAFGRGVLKNTSRENLLIQLKDKIIEEKVQTVILGLPMGKEGGDTKQTKRIREFGSELGNFLSASEFNVDIDYVDESFSTFEADNFLKEVGVKPRDRKKTEDEMAAIILVQRYIDFRP